MMLWTVTVADVDLTRRRSRGCRTPQDARGTQAWPGRRRAAWPVTSLFAAVVGLGACLLFQVQLVLGKQLLPWFGGTSAVWTTCLLFFQAALLAGYAWAHLLADRLSPRRQRDAQLSLLGIALALLSDGPSPGRHPSRSGVGSPGSPGTPISRFSGS